MSIVLRSFVYCLKNKFKQSLNYNIKFKPLLRCFKPFLKKRTVSRSFSQNITQKTQTAHITGIPILIQSLVIIIKKEIATCDNLF